MKMKKGVHGSCLVHIKDGIVTGVKFHEDFNIPAFIEHVEKPLKIAVVRSCKNTTTVKDDITPVIDEQLTTDLHELTKNDNITAPNDDKKD